MQTAGSDQYYWRFLSNEAKIRLQERFEAEFDILNPLFSNNTKLPSSLRLSGSIMKAVQGEEERAA